MSFAGNGSPTPYRVGFSGGIANEIKALANMADVIGRKQDFLNALVAIEKRLAANPHEFGERRYTLPKGGFICHIGAIEPVALQFAIHEEEHVVVVLRVFLMGS